MVLLSFIHSVSQSLKMYFLPADDSGNGLWYGYESTAQHAAPVFKARETK